MGEKGRGRGAFESAGMVSEQLNFREEDEAATMAEIDDVKVFLLGGSVFLGRMNLTYLNCGRKKGRDDGKRSE